VKGKFNIKNSYTYSHSDCNQEEFFSARNIREIENDICRLKTFSREEDRNLARKIYKKIQDRVKNIGDGNEKSKLKSLGMLINMKVKSI